MKQIRLSILTILSILAIFACEKMEEKKSNTATQGAEMDKLAITGSLSLNSFEGDTGAKGKANLVDQPVEIQDDNGETVATGKTNLNGQFHINLGGASLVNAEGNDVNMLKRPRMFKVKGVVVDDGEGNVLGARNTVIIDPSRLTREDGNSTFDSGAHQVQKIGAIVGKIELEAGASPLGIDVYIPGTSLNAKTDENGAFYLTFVPPGNYSVQIEKDGYGSISLADIQVRKKQTTKIDGTVTLKVSSGPKIESFVLKEESESSRSTETAAELTEEQSFATKTDQVTFLLKSSGAIMYKVSQRSDFLGAESKAIDPFADPLEIPYTISGEDGAKTIYLKISDHDGLEAETSITVHLDALPPKAPLFSVTSSVQRLSNATGTREVTIIPENCNDISKIFITESDKALADIKPSDFTSVCEDQRGIDGGNTPATFTLSENDGSKTLYLWALDQIQISKEPAKLEVILDTVAPSLNLTPACGADNKPIEVKPSSEESNVAFFYTIDGSDPTVNSSELLGKGLVLIADTSLKIIAVDAAGNSSAIETCNYYVDPDSPFLGSITIEGGAGLTTNPTVDITLSAVEADYYLLSETINTTSEDWKVFDSNNITYTFSSETGLKTLYVRFKDKANNIIGINDEFSDSIYLDTSALDTSEVKLLYPESPSGSFDKILQWQHSKATAGIFYEVEVHTSSNYTDTTPKRSGTSTTTMWQVPESFEPTDADTNFYWRMRIADEAGNKSAWINSSESFVIRLFATSFLPTKSYSSERSKEQYFGFNLQLLNAGSGSKYLVTTMKTTTSSCSDCGVVDIYNMDTKTIEHTFNENADWRHGYGYTITQCDLNNTGNDEIIISAPYAPYVAGSVTYHNAGKIYVYNGDTYAKIAEYSIDPSSADVNYYCYQESGNTCTEKGYPMWLDLYTKSSPWPSKDKQMTGISTSCLRVNAAADKLFVGSPGWMNGSNATVGKVDVLALSGSTLSSERVIEGPANPYSWGINGFGMSVLALDKIEINSTDVQAVLIAAPNEQANSEDNAGKVHVYVLDLTANPLTATESGTGIEDPTPSNYENFGKQLFHLGTKLHGNDTYDDFAIRSQYSVRVYQGDSGAATTPTRLYSFKGKNYPWSFGAYVAEVGDLNGDGDLELAVAEPEKQVAGVWGSGAIYVYDQSNLDDTDSENASILFTLTGSGAVSQKNLGLNIVKGKDLDSDNVHDNLIAAAPGANGQDGRIRIFSMVSMAPTLPTAIYGDKPGIKFGSSIFPAADFDADGSTDFVVGAPEANYVYPSVGKIDIISGADGSILKTIYGHNNDDERFGLDVFFAGSKVFVTSFKGMQATSPSIFELSKDKILYVLDINEYTNDWKRKYPRIDGFQGGQRIQFAKTTAEVNAIESMLIYSKGTMYVDTTNYYGAVAVASTDFPNDGGSISGCHNNSGTYSSADCRCLLVGTTDGDEFGYSATFVTDMNNDQKADIAVGAPAADNGAGKGTGKVYIFSGASCTNRATLTPANAFITIDPTIDNTNEGADRFGSSLLDLGILTGDTSSTLLITNNSHADTSSTRVGDLFAVKANATWNAPELKAHITEAGTLFGMNLLNLGDITGDTNAYPEFAVSAGKGKGLKDLHSGQVIIFKGEDFFDGTPEGSALIKFYSPTDAFSNFGAGIFHSDVTGDGLTDFIITAPLNDTATATDIGTVYIYPVTESQ